MILQTAVGTAFNAEKPKPLAEPTRIFHQESIGSAGTFMKSGCEKIFEEPE
jgi:hypothetical protein